METTNHFIGGVAFLFIDTFIIGLIGIKKELGFWGIFGIGALIGLLVAFMFNSNMGTAIGIVVSLICLLISKKKAVKADDSKAIYVGGDMKLNSVADELLKLNELKEKGVITDAEFALQKERLLKK